MPEIAGWVKIDSWHIEAPGNQTRTLCGMDVRAHPDPNAVPIEHRAEAWSLTLPMGEKSCESCLRLNARG